MQDGFCNGVVSSDVTKPREFASFYCCRQGLLLSSKESTCCLTYSFVLCSVCEMRNAGESSEAFRFKCLYASICHHDVNGRVLVGTVDNYFGFL